MKIYYCGLLAVFSRSQVQHCTGRGTAPVRQSVDPQHGAAPARLGMYRESSLS